MTKLKFTVLVDELFKILCRIQDNLSLGNEIIE